MKLSIIFSVAQSIALPVYLTMDSIVIASDSLKLSLVHLTNIL